MQSTLVQLFMNVCASYIHAINSPDQQGRTYNYTESFGPFLNPKGTTNFPHFDFKTPSILKQLDGQIWSDFPIANCAEDNTDPIVLYD